tara:strand:+ start:393 stop:716 length:324 start_codon:yes stop_codon:yes gene_type:complete
MVKIVEFINQEVPWDKVDDVHTFMINDNDFYRKEYYPMACKMNSLKTEDLMPLVDSACDQYHKKFSIAFPVEKFFGEQEKAQLAQKIHSEEMANCNKGTYRASKKSI